MAPLIEQRQEALLAHRMHFFGHPGAGNTVTWGYRTQVWLVKRPGDGEPPFHRTVRCKTCKQPLSYFIHSVEAARARQARWRACAWSGLALLILGVAGLIVILVEGSSPVRVGLTVAAMVVGFVAASVFAQTAANETGVTGHWNAWPGATKHAVSLNPSENLPRLVCPRCGHEEVFGTGSASRDGHPQRQYHDAKARLDAHDCGAA